MVFARLFVSVSASAVRTTRSGTEFDIPSEIWSQRQFYRHLFVHAQKEDENLGVCYNG